MDHAGDGEAVGQLLAQQVQAELRHGEAGSPALDGVQVADGVDAKVI